MYKQVTSIIITIIIVTTIFVSIGHAANFPLEIIQPQPNLDTFNRYYKAYPGLEYNVRMGVIRGAFPYRFELLSAPLGMTINSENGEITWSNPIEADSPHTVTVRVTDAENTVLSRSWSIAVTTSGFRFIDAINGKTVANGGDGSFANPWKEISDWYEGKTYDQKRTGAYSGDFLYWRGGTYTITNINTYVENGKDLPLVENHKPLVWLAYPGETPIIDLNRSSGENHNIKLTFNGSNRVYFDGLTFTDMLNYGIQIEDGNVGAVFRRLKMNGLGPTTGSNNQSFFRFMASAQRDNIVIQNCELYNLDHGSAIKMYSLNKSLVENNIIHDISDSLGGSLEGIAIKQDINNSTIRGNTIYNVANHPIGGNMYDLNQGFSGNEIAFNYIQNLGGHAIYVNQDGMTHGPLYVYRNTVLGTIFFNQASTGDGPFTVKDNIIISNAGVFIDTSRVAIPSLIFASNNLTGTSTSGIIDKNGNLSPTYQSSLGVVGWQVSTLLASGPPLSPSNFRLTIATN